MMSGQQQCSPASGSMSGSESPEVAAEVSKEGLLTQVRDLLVDYMKVEHLENGPDEVGDEMMLHMVHNMAKNLAEDIYKKKKQTFKDHSSRKTMNRFYMKRVKKLETDNMTLRHIVMSKKSGKQDLDGKLHVPFEKYECNEDMRHLSQKYLLGQNGGLQPLDEEEEKKKKDVAKDSSSDSEF